VDGTYEKASSSIFTLNGIQIVGPLEFSQNVPIVEKPVTLSTNNQLSVEIHGKPGGGVTVQIFGIDDGPPSISTTAAPVLNTDGWNNSDVTVSFTCSDSLSGIQSCASSVVVSTEGANQVISGTATDLAGNSATTSVTINLDKLQRLEAREAQPSTAMHRLR